MTMKNLDSSFYAELIKFAFNRDSEVNSWAWDVNSEPTSSPEQLATAIRQLCVNAGDNLKEFNNLQVAGGLTYIFNSSFSNYAFDLVHGEMPLELRRSVFQSLNVLFAECFALRCAPVLSNGKSKGPDNPLNNVCYMFWDTSNLSTGGIDALQVMENSLYHNNVACIESGLHGLGHAASDNKIYVKAAIDKFLATSNITNENLLTYAMAARSGYIQ
jgi:hypothetical protein